MHWLCNLRVGNGGQNDLTYLFQFLLGCLQRLQLDRQPMTVPARDIDHVVALLRERQPNRSTQKVRSIAKESIPKVLRNQRAEGAGKVKIADGVRSTGPYFILLFVSCPQTQSRGTENTHMNIL